MTPPFRFHPLAERFFPMMDTAALAALAEDIRVHGQHDPLVLFDGQILDGRNRYTVLQQLGITPTTTTFTGTEADAAAFVMSKNRQRRHLTTAQKALAEVEYRDFYQQQAKARMDAGREKSHQSRREKLGSQNYYYPINPLKNEEHTENVAPTPPAKGRWSEVAAAAGVSHNTIYQAKRVMDSGNKEVMTQVKAGRMTLNKADTLLKAPQGSARTKTSPKARRYPRPEPGVVKTDPDDTLKGLQYLWHLATASQRSTFLAWIATLEETHGKTHPLLQTSPRL